MDRRSLLMLAGTGAMAGALGTPISAAARPSGTGRPLRVLVATNEPWGTYHIEALLDEAAAARKRGKRRITLVVPDMSNVSATETVPVVTLDDAAAWNADLLVVNGATEWPTRVVEALPNLPVVATSLAYLTPDEAAGARTIRPRLVGMTAASEAEAEVFAGHFGVKRKRITVVGNIGLDTLPEYRPEARTALIATSVTRSSETGGAAPGAQVLLDSAAALSSAGWRVRVGLHPREDRSLWAAYETATEGTVPASATAEVTVGIPGSVFPRIAAIGCPLVGVVADGLTVPDYILALCAQVRTAEEAVAAAEAKWRPDEATLTAAVGPIGGAGERLWRYWQKAVTHSRRKKARRHR